MDTLETTDLVNGLISIGETLGSGLSIDDQMQTLSKAVTSILRCDSAGIMLRDGEYLYGKYSHGIPGDLVDLFPLYRVPVDGPIIQRVTRSDGYLVINDAKAEPTAAELAEMAQITALVLAPIFLPNGSLLAIMGAHYREGIGKFDETRGQLVLGAAKMAQLALVSDRERVTRVRTIASRRELIGELTRAEDAERSRISREIHDDSMQRVLAIRLKLNLLSDKETDPETKLALQGLADQGARTAESLRNLLQNLHPRGLESEGLAVALEEVLTRTAVGTGWQVSLVNELEMEPASEVGTVLYRAALQAFTSIETRNKATQVHVRLRTVERGTEMLVTDDGPGIDSTAVRSGQSTLAAMRTRVEHTGGVLDISDSDTSGTQMRIWIPLQIFDRATS